ncbi:MAG: glycosyltransferase family 39 protein [Patescibacteria group bacterium]
MQLEKSFLRICFAFAIYLSAILALAVFGFFSKIPVAVVSVMFIALSAYYLLRTVLAPKKEQKNKTAIVSFFIILLFSLIAGYFHHDIPTARDDLSYIYSADRLTQSGSLVWEDYFTRPVHGVRNLDGDKFTSQFLPTYTGYLAVYHMFGGLQFLLWANVLLMLLTFGIFYFLVKELAGGKASLIALIFLLSTYVFFWFPKRTNVENISIFFIWLGVWLAVLAVKKRNPKYIMGGLIPFSLLTLTRPEGLIFFAVYLVVAVYLILYKYRKEFVNNRLSIWLGAGITVLNLVIFYFYVMYYEAGYIMTQALDVIEGFDYIYKNTAILLLSVLLVGGLIFALIKFYKRIDFNRLLFYLIISSIVIFELIFLAFENSGELTWTVYRTQYVFENFAFYFYFIFIFIILLGLRKKLFTVNEFIVTLVLLPAFLFIIEPNIALDQPWFMRRFFPTLIPLFAVLSAVVIVRLDLPKKQLRTAVTLIAIIGIISARTILFFVENKGLTGQVEEFNKIFHKDSLVVMDPGWGWQKIALIQHYFYDMDTLPNIDLYRSEEFKKDLPEVLPMYPDWEQNNDDLLGIMNWQMDKSEQHFINLLDQYEEVYIVTDEESSNYFNGFADQNLESVGNFTFRYKELNKESSITGYIQQTKIIDLKKIRGLQDSIPPNRISRQEINLFIYKVKDIRAYVPFEYVSVMTDDMEKGKYYVTRNELDLQTYKKDLQNVVRDVDLGID